MRWQKTDQIATIPMRVVGPVKIISAEVSADVPLPLATLESPLWPSTHRGARVCTHAGGIKATVIDERMTRSVLVEADSAAVAHQAYLAIQRQQPELQKIISASSRFAK